MGFTVNCRPRARARCGPPQESREDSALARVWSHLSAAMSHPISREAGLEVLAAMDVLDKLEEAQKQQ